MDSTETSLFGARLPNPLPIDPHDSPVCRMYTPRQVAAHRPWECKRDDAGCANTDAGSDICVSLPTRNRAGCRNLRCLIRCLAAGCLCRCLTPFGDFGHE